MRRADRWLLRRIAFAGPLMHPDAVMGLDLDGELPSDGFPGDIREDAIGGPWSPGVAARLEVWDQARTAERRAERGR